MQYLCTSKLLFTCIALGPTAATAESSVTAMLGFSTGTEFYTGDDADLGLFASLVYERDNVSISLAGIHYTFAPEEALSFSVGIAPRFRPDFPDGSLYEGLDRDGTAEAVFSGTYRFGEDTRLTATVQHDLLSKHDGYEASLALGQSIEFSSFTLGGEAGVRHRSAELNQYLVGVGPSEVTAARAAYTPGSTTSPFAALSVTMPIGERTALVGSASFDYVGDAYKDSPLVAKSLETTLNIGLAYRF